jgi:hypothetical protein
LLAGILTAAADTEAPLHDWTVQVHGRPYGFTSWAAGHWDMYVGRLVEPGASPIVQCAVVLLAMLLLAVGSCWRSVALLRLSNPLVQRMRDSRCCLQLGRQWSRTADHRRYMHPA